MNIYDFFRVSDELYKDTLKPICEKYKITYMELTIILFLGNNPGLDKASDLVNKRHIAKSHASASIKSLMDNGLIEGRCFENDRRSVHLELTKDAYKILKDGQVAQKEFVNSFLSGLSKDEKETLIYLLKKMETNLIERSKNLKNGK